MLLKTKKTVHGWTYLFLCIVLAGNISFAGEKTEEPIEEHSLQVTVEGTVVSGSDGLPLPGVTVQVQGTNNGVVTDFDGNYEIEVQDPDAVLVFSYVGFVTQEVPVDGRSTIDVTLEEDVAQLDEVVVIGYQQVRRRDLTGATSIVTPEEANRVTSTSLAESLQGLASGVTVRNSGNPGEGAQIEIRGAASFLNTSPLYVIDGMISDAGPNLSTDEIESIQVLKDASAAAIYGSRAANGVVIITTKQGREGPPKIEVSAKYGIAQMPGGYDVMNAREYASLVRQQYSNSGITPPESVGINDSFVPQFDTDWQDAITRTGQQQDYNLSASGGSENARYLISAGYFDNTGVIEGNSFNRASLRINTELDRGRFSFGENFVVNHAVHETSNQGNAFYDMVTMLPVIPVRDESYVAGNNPMGWGIGSPEAVTYSWNTLAVNQINPFTSNVTKAVGNAYVDFEITDWLTYRFNAGLEGTFTNTKTLFREGIWRYTQQRGPTAVEEGRGEYFSYLFDHTFNFDKDFGRHSIDGVVGYSSQETQASWVSARRTELQSFNGEYLEEINSATGESSTTGFVDPHYRIQGILGRLNYIYDEKYQVTLTGRYDQDSRFAEQYRSDLFPSVAAAWTINNEPFFESDLFSQLKLRGSYGELGIVTVGSWDYIPLLNSSQRAVFGVNQNPQVGANQAQLTNTDLRWEKRRMTNIGIDGAMFNNRLNFSVEWYHSESDDALINQVLPGYLGNLGGNPPVNAGGISNTGFEFSATYRNMERAVQWDISGNLTTIRNSVESVGQQGEGIDYIQTGVSRSQVGRSVGEWFLIRTDGLFQSQQEVDNHRNSNGDLIQPNAQPGDVRFVDLNDDGDINQEDRDFVGSPWPDLQAGLQFNASYNNFSLSTQFVGVFGNTLYNDVRRSLDNYQESNFRADIDPWTPQNTNTSDPRIGVVSGDAGLVDNARADIDRWLESGSYVRLRNIEIGYSLTEELAERLMVNYARVYISGQNLFTITEYTGPDPDVTGAGTHQRGMDTGNWPANRIYSIGLQFEF